MPHLRVAASEAAFKKLFAKVVDKFVFEKADSKDLGPFTAGFVSESTGSLATGVMANLAMVPLGLIALAVAIRWYPAAEASRLAQAAATTPI